MSLWFLAFALVSLALGVLLAIADPRILDGHYYREPVFGLTHIFTLGWISMGAMGMLFRLSRLVFGAPARTGFWPWTLLALWLTGGAGIVFHMARGEWFGLWTAGLCAWIGTLVLPVCHPAAIRRARRGDWIARYCVAAMAHLVLAASLGLFIGMNKHLGWVSVNPIALLGAHIHLAIVGWVGFLILGVGQKLHPPLAPAKHSRIHPGWRFAGLELSLAGMIAGFLWLPQLLLPAATLGVATLGVHVARPLGRLVRGPRNEPASTWVGVSLLGLLAGALVGWLRLAGVTSQLGIGADRADFAYGFLLLFGWITPAMAAFAGKVLPLILLEVRGEPPPGTELKRMVSRPLQVVTGLAFGVGAGVLATGLLLDASPTIRAGTWIYAMGAMSFVMNVVGMVFKDPGSRRWNHVGKLGTHGRAMGGGTSS